MKNDKKQLEMGFGPSTYGKADYVPDFYIQYFDQDGIKQTIPAFSRVTVHVESIDKKIIVEGDGKIKNN